MKSPTGTIKRVEGERLMQALAAQGWTITDERPAPKRPRTPKPGTYYVNHTNLSGY